MGRLLRLLPVLFAFLWPAGAQAQGSLVDLFGQGKAESKEARYEASLATFQKLDDLSRQPGNEAERVKLEPLIAFYRGVNLAALGRKESARKEFETYLSSFPAARMDPAMFPRAAIDVFTAAREGLRVRDPASGGDSAMARDFAAFRPEAGRPGVFDESWSQGAIRYLMTKSEIETWKRLTGPQEQAEFVARFWQRRDPDPVTPQNEFRDEIERRIRFADARFALEETKGSETDRGMIFVLLGPPSYVGQKALKTENDPVQSARAAPVREREISGDGSTTVRLVPRTGLTAETIEGTREIWYYRRDRLPAAVKYPEVDFEFITKKGAGTAVLQRTPDILVALEQAFHASLPADDSGK